MEKPLFLIGYMGVGKTTLGKKLARKLGVSFIDTDQAIEKQTGQPIGELFSQRGESHFRALEKKWLIDFSESNAVIATGGGMPCDEERLSLMKEKGTVIYLERPAKELFTRLKNAKSHRPLVAELSDEALLSFIEAQLLDRSKYYKKAHYIVNRTTQDVPSILKLLGV